MLVNCLCVSKHCKLVILMLINWFYSAFLQNDVGSSSGSNVRSSLLAMGFSPSLVDRAIEENGMSCGITLFKILLQHGWEMIAHFCC